VACTTGTLSIGGTVSGLVGSGLVLQDNGGDNLTITANGSFTFLTLLPSNTGYAVTVLSQPTNPAQACVVTNGTGTATANVTTVQVTCSGGTLTIGGQVTDLLGKGLVLQDNGGDNLTVNASGNFTFATPVANNGPYKVTILTQPTAPAQTCVVANGSGTATVIVTNVSVSCGPIFTIGGTITNLLGSGLVLLDNGGDNLTITANGSFTFKTPLANGESYAVTILTQPTNPAQTCTLTNPSGTAIGNITNIQISCSLPKFTVSGVVVGLVTGPPGNDTVEIQDNAGDDLFVTGDTSFTFPTQFTYGTTYSVNLFLLPTSQPQPCTVFNASAVITADVSNVIVDCQHNDWAWIFPGPTPTINQYGTASLPTYTVGQPILPPSGANGNTPGGRDFPMAWTDTQGRRWLFGGSGFEVTHANTNNRPGLLNDMWVWPSEDGWWSPGGWIPANLPIAQDSSGLNALNTQYYAVTNSLQAQGTYGFYGTLGSGVSCASLNQTPACTFPGSRWGGVTWTDAAGNLWMFGGQGFADASYGLLNDVWEFTPGVYCGADAACNGTTPPAAGTGIWTGTWTWQAGLPDANQLNSGTFPGGRWAAANYTDAAGNVWMFGGQGYDSAGNLGVLNDLWRYNIGSATWTQVSGSILADQNGVYGAQPGVPGGAPGGREGAVLWTDASGTIWLFGGFGMDSVGTTGVTPNGTPKGATLNDLWKFSGGQWTWVAGSNIANQNGIYGTPTVAAATNMPGSRWGSAAWSDPTGGELWLFGGFGYGSSVTLGTGFLNDVWEYTTSTGQWTWWKGSADVNQSGTYITAPFNYFQLYYTNNIVGARRGAARWLPDALGHYVYIFGGEGYDATTGGPYGELNDIWGYLPFP
jgi:hypothetical protein